MDHLPSVFALTGVQTRTLLIKNTNFLGFALFITKTNSLAWQTLRGDKVSMLIHSYSHKPLREIKVSICNHQVDSSYFWWPGVSSGDLQAKSKKEYGHMWHQMSLMRPWVTKQQ